ncbi:DUF6311 domain-containing protein [Fluviispira multicolorata]|nr:DUF6311 domain-containing protein [Fluviispira multicolorata]
MENENFFSYLKKIRKSKILFFVFIIISAMTALLVYFNQDSWILLNCTLGKNSNSCVYKFERLYLLPITIFLLLNVCLFTDEIFKFLKLMSIKLENLETKKSAHFLISFSVVFSLLLFYYRFSFFIIDPTRVFWIKSLGTDSLQNFLGWHVFRNSPWDFPFGVMQNINYPIGTSVGYSDSVPFLAFLFKLFTNFLPEYFQYFGIWVFSCYILQGFFAAQIFKNFKCSMKLKLLAVPFLIMSTVLLDRFGHLALNCHWMILASFFLYFSKEISVKRKTKWQTLIVIFSSWVHPYITFLMFALQTALFIKLYIENKKYLKELLSYFLMSLFLVFSSWYLIGYFYLDGGNDPKNVLFSINLNTLFNPFEKSKLMQPLGAGPRHYEGFAYLGVGLLIILIVLLFEKWEEKKYVFIKENKPLIWILAILTCLSLSYEIKFGTLTIINTPIPEVLESFYGVYRSVGRFIWPTYYFIVIFILLSLLMRERSLIKKCTLLLIALLLQFIDIYPLYKPVNLNYKNDFNIERNLAPWLHFMAGNKNKIIFYPNRQYSYIDFWMLASKYHYSVNIGYFARNNSEKILENDANTYQNIINGKIPNDTIYVVLNENIKVFEVSSYKDNFICENIQEFYACKNKN